MEPQGLPEVAERKSFLLRLDARLYDELKRWAGVELRSVNGQIEFILRDAVRRRKRKGSEEEDDASV